MQRAPFLCFVFLFSLTVSTVNADDHSLSATEAIEARQMQMKTYQRGLKVLGDMVRGRRDYDAAAAAASAAAMLDSAMLAPELLWQAGTDINSGMDTRAKGDIWVNFEDFSAKSESMRRAAEALNTAAATDLDALRAAMGPVGDACSACHRPYRGRR